jgi:hypothetical protein
MEDEMEYLCKLCGKPTLNSDLNSPVVEIVEGEHLHSICVLLHYFLHMNNASPTDFDKKVLEYLRQDSIG